MKKLLSTLLFISCVTSAPAFNSQQEKIYSYRSDIVINKDASMIVTETIRVKALGINIKRGIYRDFPTVYKDDLGNRIIVGLDILGVYRDNRPEDYHTESIQNGIRIYIGNKNTYLSRGDYTYKLVYKTNRQIGYFPDHDELYWNVTGNGWMFPIEKAAAVITLPDKVPSSRLRYYGFTGRQGSRESNLAAESIIPGMVSYKTTYPLGSYEGLTVVLEFPKGIVAEPATLQKLGYFTQDNKTEIVGIIGLLIILFYYITVWTKVGRDPNRDLIIPLFKPPDNLSPAAVRYITRMGYDNKTFAASIINMAVKGYFKIKEENGKYSLIKLKSDASELSKEEKKIAAKLQFSRNNSNGVQVEEALEKLNGYKNSNNFFARAVSGILTSAIQNRIKTLPKDTPSEEEKYELELKNTNHTIFSSAINSLKKELKNSFEKTYFLTNRKQFVTGLVISAVLLISAFALGSGEQIGLLTWIMIWSAAVGALVINLFRNWKNVFSGGRFKISLLGGAIFSTFFAIPFIIGEFIGIYFFYNAGSVISVILVGSVVFLNILFYHLLKAPTLLGRKVLDKIEGFQMYLSTAEEDRLNYLTPVDKTPELFERYLPYAFALDVEQKWSEQFADVLAKAAIEQNYSPLWYSGSGWNSLNTSDFTSSFSSSFSGAVSSSSSAPGSSSGSGGSSGGGGGGGGGGGW